MGVWDSFCFDSKNNIGRVIHRTAVKVAHCCPMDKSLLLLLLTPKTNCKLLCDVFSVGRTNKKVEIVLKLQAA